MNKTLAERLEDNYKSYVLNGGTVEIDHKLGTATMKFGNNKSVYFPDTSSLWLMGDDLDTLGTCPEDVSEEAWLVYTYI